MIGLMVSELFDIKGKTAIVTGASSGLGIVFAETLAEMGVNLQIAARRFDKLETVADRLRNYGVEVVPFRCDVSNHDNVEDLIEDAVINYGKIDILVNNAGISSAIPATEISMDEWREVIEVNLTGVFSCSRSAARQMIKQNTGGKIINISSIYGFGGDVFPASPYYASKGAVINLTRGLAAEWAKYRINVNAIAPGFFPSEMTQDIFRKPEYVEYIRNQTPLGRPGTEDDLKGAVAYLASGASDYVTGQTITVDGGWTIW